MRLIAFFVFALFFGFPVAQAEPAPFYWWVSVEDGTRVCSQIPLGEGWQQEAKPFKDARCRVPLAR